MEFCVEHVIRRMDRLTFEKLFFDEALNAEMCERLHLRRKLCDISHEGTRLRREVEMEIGRRIPDWIRRFIGLRKLTYRETMTYIFARPKGAASWRITPGLFASQIDCAGSVDFLPHPEGIVRRVDGQVSIRIPVVGPYMERVAIREIIASFDEAAALTDAWLAEHPAVFPPNKGIDDGSAGIS